MNWKKLKQIITERFMNWETAEGFYFICAGLAFMFVTHNYQQYLFYAFGMIFGWYWVSRGAWQMWVNRYNETIKKQKILAEKAESVGE